VSRQVGHVGQDGLVTNKFDGFPQNHNIFPGLPLGRPELVPQENEGEGVEA